MFSLKLWLHVFSFNGIFLSFYPFIPVATLIYCVQENLFHLDSFLYTGRTKVE